MTLDAGHDNTIAESTDCSFARRGWKLCAAATLADLVGGDHPRQCRHCACSRKEAGTRAEAGRSVAQYQSATLFVAGRVRTTAETLAAELIDGGKAQAKLAELAKPWVVTLRVVS